MRVRLAASECALVFDQFRYRITAIPNVLEVAKAHLFCLVGIEREGIQDAIWRLVSAVFLETADQIGGRGIRRDEGDDWLRCFLAILCRALFFAFLWPFFVLCRSVLFGFPLRFRRLFGYGRCPNILHGWQG